MKKEKQVAVLYAKCDKRSVKVTLTETENVDSHRLLVEEFCNLANTVLGLSGRGFPKIGIIKS